MWLCKSLKCLNNEPEVQNIQAATWVYVGSFNSPSHPNVRTWIKIVFGCVILVNPILKNTQSSENVWRSINKLEHLLPVAKKKKGTTNVGVQKSHHLHEFFFFPIFVISKIWCKEKGQQHHEIWLDSRAG
jgi:hypothetical protein